MPKITKMINKMANTGSLAASQAIGLSNAFENTGSPATSLAKHLNAYDNEVDYRPAAQQWTVCTP